MEPLIEYLFTFSINKRVMRYALIRHKRRKPFYEEHVELQERFDVWIYVWVTTLYISQLRSTNAQMIKIE